MQEAIAPAPKNNKPAQAGESLYSGRFQPAVFLPASQEAGIRESRHPGEPAQIYWAATGLLGI
ncbi:hypothetical protein [Kamptonema formosum]|uniref:hypothetical protein n=1 Tax=Kamptonema formosum TaxID=331992 RepID=UPI00037D3601|nr:hypothetical protein [Oscillatoria sp. PCC 10802]